METTLTKRYEIRFSGMVECDMEPIMHDIAVAIDKGTLEESDKAFAEFVMAPQRIVVKRQGNNTYAVDLSIEGVIAFAKEVAYRKENAIDIRTDEGSYDRNGYNYHTKVIRQLDTALKGANKVLASVGIAPVTSYWN
jgi:hypothetical protein